MSDAPFSLPAAVHRNLSDKSYEKRKNAARELEEMVKNLASLEECEKISKLIEMLTKEFVESNDPNHRMVSSVVSRAEAVAFFQGSNLPKHVLAQIECEPEYLMPDFGSNPDIEEKPPMSLRECLEKVKPFIVANEGIKDQEELEEAIDKLMEQAPNIKEIVDHYSGPDRVTAKKQNEELDRTATTIPKTAPDSVKRFADRAALSLKQMAPTKQAKVIKDFQKQSAQLDMTIEMMSDAIDETLDKDEAEEET